MAALDIRKYRILCIADKKVIVFDKTASNDPNPWTHVEPDNWKTAILKTSDFIFSNLRTES